MPNLNSSTLLIIIAIVLVGIFVLSGISARNEKTWGDRIAKFFGVASNAAILFTIVAFLYQVIDSEEEGNGSSLPDCLTSIVE